MNIFLENDFIDVLKPNSLVRNDCLNVLSKVSDKSIELICCDLPYQIHACEWDCLIDMKILWKEYERILKPGGNILLFGSGTFAFKLALSNEKLFRYDMVWKKSKCGSPMIAKYMPLKKHEMILVFGKPAAYYNPQMLEGEPYKRIFTKSKTNNLNYNIHGGIADNKGTRHPSTVLDFPQQWRRQDQVHPTQKPVELLEWLIKSYSKEGDTVLDNCMGSGTCGIAAKNLNRQFIGIEKDEKFFEICKKRILNIY